MSEKKPHKIHVTLDTTADPPVVITPLELTFKKQKKHKVEWKQSKHSPDFTFESIEIDGEFWGYASEEELDNHALIRERYQGIRPAPGYPACPDHTEKGILFELLNVPENAGITLTESFAMWPTAAVSGLYFSHPQSAYFGLGKIGRDQVEDYAQRKGMDLAEAEKWLSPNLGYET